MPPLSRVCSIASLDARAARAAAAGRAARSRAPGRRSPSPRRAPRSKYSLGEPHQLVDLRLRAVPVLDRERVEREHLDAELAARRAPPRAPPRLPARWPSIRDSPRRSAQRPLPSMMMATWRGRPSFAGESPRVHASDLEDLLLLLRPIISSIFLMCSSVSVWIRFSSRRRSSAGSVPSDSRSFSIAERVAARLAHADLVLLGELVHVLDQVLAALLGERRDRDPHHLAVVARA